MEFLSLSIFIAALASLVTSQITAPQFNRMNFPNPNNRFSGRNPNSIYDDDSWRQVGSNWNRVNSNMASAPLPGRNFGNPGSPLMSAISPRRRNFGQNMPFNNDFSNSVGNSLIAHSLFDHGDDDCIAVCTLGRSLMNSDAMSSYLRNVCRC